MVGRGEVKEIALKRIRKLFELAIKALPERPDLAQRYVEIARRIGMRAKVRMPRENRMLICRHCKRFIFPGVSSRVRIQPRREPHIVITCLYCGGHMRKPLRRRK
ncbi:ribonuclease P [Candidatus Bathyarchaeota archaeon]|nr:ribonuclease P [Candidatus Bathyarchaeota archaeon]